MLEMEAEGVARRFSSTELRVRRRQAAVEATDDARLVRLAINPSSTRQ
jgi:hypothetical protein